MSPVNEKEEGIGEIFGGIIFPPILCSFSMWYVHSPCQVQLWSRWIAPMVLEQELFVRWLK